MVRSMGAKGGDNSRCQLGMLMIRPTDTRALNSARCRSLERAG